MVRPRSIDREQLLDLAQELVAEGGADSLSFGSLAKAASLPKASVQAVFGSRKAMVEALLTRWMAHEAGTYHALLGDDISAGARLKAHLKSTQREQSHGSRTASALLATLASSGQASSAVKSWYRDRMDGLVANDLESRKRRLAYLAAEGAFLLRNLVGLEVDDDQWDLIFRDIEEILS